MNFRTLFFLTLTLIWSTTSDASTGMIPASKFLHRTELASLSVASQGTGYIVDGAALAKALAAGGHIQLTEFPGGAGDLVTLDLKPAHSPIDATTQFWIGSASGSRRYTPPAFAAFCGKVLGEPNSRVFLTTFAGKLLVTITRESGVTYDFGPAKNSEVPGAHILIPENNLFAYGEFHPLNCIAGDIPQPNAPEPVSELLKEYRERALSGASPHTKLLETDIAVEADSSFYFAAGNDTNTVLGYIESLFAMSSTIYEDEVNITWHLTWVKLWPNHDPYNAKGNASALIDTVPKYWRAHYDTVRRDLAHVLTSNSYGGGGYGYYSICDPNWSYSMSSPQTGHQYPTFAFTYDAYIVAHEVGHNFSLVHTEECYWDPPIDTCFTKDDTLYSPPLRLGDACETLPIHPLPNPGSIMSYCANANYEIHHDSIQYFKLRMTFTPKVDSVLRMHAENDSACITSPANPTLILLSPRGSETYPGDTIITLEWTYANLDSVSLQYSPDGGTFWTPIAQNLPAAQGTYLWKVPNTASTNMLVRVIDASNPSLADTSLLFFTVTPSASVSALRTTAGDFRLSPNPAQDYLTLTGGTAGEQITYSIVNAAGVKILSGTAVERNSVFSIALTSLPNGTYYLHLSSPISQVLPFIRSK